MNMGLELLTASRLKAWRTCQRQHYYAYDMGVRPVTEAPALRFGTAIHAGLEAWWRAHQAGAPDAALGAMLAALPTDLDPFVRVRAEVMLLGYDVAWEDLARRCTVLAIEAQFTLPLRNPGSTGRSLTWQLAGKLDGLVRLPDGRVAVLEHKTSSEEVGPGSDYRRRLTLDAQVSMYFAGADALGYPAEVCLYDVLAKPSQKPLEATPVEKRRYKKDGAPYAGQREHNETPEDYRERLVEAVTADPGRYYQHAEVVRFEEEHQAHAFNVWQVGQQIQATRVDAKRIGARAFVQNGDACARYGTPCPYRDVCDGIASLEDPTRFTRIGPHPELVHTAPAAAG